MRTEIIDGQRVAIIEWRPDGLGDGRTWADIMAAVARTEGPIVITTPQPETDYLVGEGVIDLSGVTIKNDLELRRSLPPVLYTRPQPMNRHQRRAQQKRDRARR